MIFKVIPIDFEMELKECPPGLFLFKDTLGFKDEYGSDPYCTNTGEYFWGGATNATERGKLKVIPCLVAWENE